MINSITVLESSKWPLSELMHTRFNKADQILYNLKLSDAKITSNLTKTKSNVT